MAEKREKKLLLSSAEKTRFYDRAEVIKNYKKRGEEEVLVKDGFWEYGKREREKEWKKALIGSLRQF